MENHSLYQTLIVAEPEVPRFDSQTVYYNLDFETNLRDTRFTTKTGEKIECPSPTPPCSRQDDPFEWFTSKKALHLVFAMISVTSSSFAASSYSPISEQIAKEWAINQVANMCGIFAFTMAFAISPMFAAPFSELVGRRRVILTSGVIFLGSTLACGLTQRFYGFVVLASIAYGLLYR